MTTIDERVVQMRFDNKQFEEGARQSMSTLEKFKASLDFKGAAGKADSALNDMADTTDILKVNFDALSVVAVTALTRITNAAISTGKRMLESLTVEPISQGFSEYELKMNSVQTIMNSTGESLQTVSKYLEELNTYADRTIYSFSDMTSNIGKFTNSGVSLDKAVKAIQGVSNEAALAGANANEASRAMYNFAQALSSGSVRLIDWKSIENANMATVEFKQELLNTAVALGTVVEKNGEYISTTTDLNGHVSDAFTATKMFNDSLSAQWMTTDVLIETLGRYADETTDLGQRAYAAAQDVKTFSQLMDTLKESVGSGWAQTWEIIFGNFDEAKELWTNVSNVIGGFIDQSSKARNELLQGWKDLGGRTAIFDTIAAAFHNVIDVVNTLRDAFTTVFPPITAKQLYNATLAVKQFVESLKFSEGALKTISEAFKFLLIPVNIFVQGVRVAIAAISGLIPLIFKLVDAVLALPSNLDKVGEALRNVLGNERYEKFVTALSSAVDTLGHVFSALGTAVKNVISGFKQLDRSKLGASLSRLAELLKPIAGWIFDRITEGLESISKIDYSKLTDWAEKGLVSVVDILSNIVGFVKMAKDAIVEFFTGFNTKTPEQFFAGITTSVSSLGLAFKNFLGGLNAGSVLDTIGEKTSGLTNFIKGLAMALQALMEKLTPAKILVFAFGVSLIGTMSAISKAFKAFAEIGESISGMFTGVTGIFEAIQERIKPNKIQQISVSLLALAGALFIISLIRKDKLLGAVGAMSALMAELTLMVAAFAAIQKFLLKSKDIGKTLVQVSVLMLSIAGAVAVLAVAMNMLASINFNDVWAPLLLLGTTMVALTTTMAILSKKAPELSKNALTLVAFALAIKIVVSSLSDLAKMDFKSIIGSLTAVVVTMGLLAAISVLTKNVTFGNAAGFTMMIFDLLVVATALKMLSNTDPEKLIKGIMAFMGVMVAFIPLAIISNMAGESAKSMGVGLLSITAAVLVLGVAIKTIGSLDAGVAVKGTIVVGVILALFGGLMALSNLIGRNANKMSGTFLSLSAAILILGVAIDYIGGMSLGKIVKGTAVVAALMAMFGVLMVASSQAQQVKGLAMSMAVVIGVLVASLMLLTLLPFGELMRSVTVLGTVLLAFGASMALLKGADWKAGLASVLVMASVISGLTLAFILMNKMDTTSLLVKVGALSAVMLALATTLKIISTIGGDAKLSVQTLVGAASVLAAAGIVTLLLETMPFSDGLIEKAASMSIMMLAIAGVMAVLGTIKTSGSDSIKNAAAFAIVATVVVGLIAGIGLISAAFDKEGVFADYGAGFMAKLTPLIPIILTLAAVTAILSKVGGAVKTAGEGALGFAKVVLIITGVIAGIGMIAYAIESLGVDINKVMADAQIIFFGLAEIIGGTIGRLITGTGVAITAGLAQMGQNLSDFAERSSGFFVAMSSIDSKVLDGVVKMVEMMTLLTAGNFINQILTFGLSKPLVAFGDQLNEFAPKFVEFANQLKDIPVDATLAAAECLLSLSQLLNAIPSEGGFLQDIMGGRSFAKFGEGLKDFAEGFKGYCDILATADVTAEMVNATRYATDALVELANKVPASGGLLQGFFGEHNIGKFGEDLTLFGQGLHDFFVVISGADSGVPVDFSVVEACSAAGEALAKFANKVPAAGGAMQSFLGAQDIGVFGGQLVAFGRALKNFFVEMFGVEIDQKLVNACAKAGEAFAQFSEKIPRMGGAFEFFTGTKDMAVFGEQIKGFGEGLASFFSAFRATNVTEEDVKLANIAMEGFGKLSQSIGTTGGLSSVWSSSSLSDYGDQIKSFGTALQAYYTEISDINFDKVNVSVAAAQNILKITEGLKDTGITITDKVKQILSDIVSAANETLGITGEYSIKFYNMGKYIVEGLKRGVEQNKGSANATMRDFGYEVTDSFAASVGVNSPSTKFAEIGMYIVAGLRQGIEKNITVARNAVIKMGQSLVGAIRGFFGIRSPSTVMRDEVGRYLIQGIAEGITEDMSAEEAAAQKAQNIIDAFKDEFDKFSLDMTTADTEYNLWSAQNPYADVDKLREKNVELLTKKLQSQAGQVNLANVQYQATLKALGEEAEETQQAYNTYLEEQLTMYQLASELAETKKDVLNSARFDTTTEELMLELWEKTSGNVTEQEKAQKQLEILSKQLEGQAYTVARANAIYQNLLQQLGEDADTTRQAYQEYLQAQINMADLASEVSELRNGKTENDDRTQREKFQDYANKLSEMYESLSKMGFSDEEIKQWAMDESGWRPMVEGAESSIQGIINEFMGKVDTSLVEISDGVGTNVTGIVDEFLKSAEWAITDAGQGLEILFTNPVVSAVDSAVSAGSSAAGSGGGSVGSALSDAIGEGFVDGMPELTETVTGSLEEMMGKLGLAGANLGSITGEDTSKSFADRLNDGIRSAGDAVVPKIRDLFGLTAEASVEGGAAAGEAGGRAYVNGEVMAIDENSIYAQIAADNAARSTGEVAAKTSAETGYAAGKVGDEQAAKGITNNSGVAERAAVAMAENAAAAAQKSLASGMMLAGTNAALGMAAGMQSLKATQAISAASNGIASLATNTTKRALDEHSPSRVFYQIGQYIDQGLANGIMDGSDIIMGAVDKITNSLANSGASMGITPVLDMDELETPSTATGRWVTRNGKRAWIRTNPEADDFYNTVLQWDASGELVPYGYTNSGDIGRWLKVEKSAAMAIREGNAVLAQQAYEAATVGRVHMGETADLPTYNFVQNNTSPKSLSTAEIYRDTKTMFSNAVKQVTDLHSRLSGSSIRTLDSPIVSKSNKS